MPKPSTVMNHYLQKLSGVSLPIHAIAAPVMVSNKKECWYRTAGELVGVGMELQAESAESDVLEEVFTIGFGCSSVAAAKTYLAAKKKWWTKQGFLATLHILYTVQTPSDKALRDLAQQLKWPPCLVTDFWSYVEEIRSLQFVQNFPFDDADEEMLHGRMMDKFSSLNYKKKKCDDDNKKHLCKEAVRVICWYKLAENEQE